MRFTLLLAVLFLVSCKEEIGSKTETGTTCRGIYYQRESGVLKKYNQYLHNGVCLTENVSLSRFETTQEKWNKNNVQCVPQNFSPRSLVAANNYYSHRDGKAFLDFSSDGVFRRIIKTQNKEGEEVISKLQGCFYVRGNQILLDTDVNKLVSNQYFDPMEIFEFTEVGPNLQMLRFDDTRDYDFRNCPYLNTPWQFCQNLRDGNEMFFPTLTAQQMSDLTAEAIIISIQYNWVTFNTAQFDSMWEDVLTKESIREDYLYDVIHIPDVPRYIDQAWRDYVMGNRPTMPDVNSSTDINICYQGSQNVTLSNGNTGKVYGEICYIDGQYVFTQN